MEIILREEQVNLHNGDEDLLILHFSDIHLWFSTKILAKIETIIHNVNPDLIIMTGDYYDFPKGAMNFRKFLQKTSINYPIVFIKGNHDVIYGKKILNLLLNIPNCNYVESSIYRFQSKKGKNYNITSWNNKQNLNKNDDEKNIVLIHNPEKIKNNELDNIDMILAGHLHGGQFIFFKTKNNSNFPGSILYKNCTDRKIINNTELIVSKGLGDTFPFRYNCPKEIVEIRIN